MVEEAQPRCQKRVLLFSFDGGSGIGHLRRLSRIAKSHDRFTIDVPRNRVIAQLPFHVRQSAFG